MYLKVINLMDFPYTMPKELFNGNSFVIPNDGREYKIPYYDYKNVYINGIKIVEVVDNKVVYNKPEFVEIDLDKVEIKKEEKKIEDKIQEDEKDEEEDVEEGGDFPKPERKRGGRPSNKVKEPNFMKDDKEEKKLNRKLTSEIGNIKIVAEEE